MKAKLFNKKVVRFVIIILIAFTILLITLGIIYQYNSSNQPLMQSTDSNDIIFENPDEFYFSPTSEEHMVYDEKTKTTFADNELIIIARPSIPKEKMEKLAKEYDADIASYSKGSENTGGMYTFRFNRRYTYEELKKIVNIFENLDYIEKATINIAVHYDISYVPNDPTWDSWEEDNPKGNNWGLEAINVLTAWDYKDKMKAVDIGIFDNAFYTEHEDLHFAENPIDNPDTISDSHGTHVVGTIGATFDNEIGISGVSPQNNLYGYSTEKIVSLQDTLNMLNYLIEIKNCKVINISQVRSLLGFSASRGNPKAVEDLEISSKLIEEKLLNLIDKGYDFVICQSAGNQWETNPTKAGARNRYRADERADYGYVQDNKGKECGNVDASFNEFSCIENEKVRNRIIVVGAIQRDGKDEYSLANFSQRGDRVDVTAPGVKIYSTVKDKSWFGFGNDISGYSDDSGTSMAAPHVSGLAAMMFAINSDLTGEEVKQIICNTANKDLYNLIDAGEAVRVAELYADPNFAKIYLKPVKNDFELSILNSQDELHTNYNLKVELESESFIPLTTDNREVLFDLDIQEGSKELHLDNGLYYITITNLDNSEQQKQIRLVVWDKGTVATDKVDIYTDFISMENTARIDLTQFIGKDIYEVAKQIENMEDVGATSAIEFSNGSVIIGDKFDRTGVDFMIIEADCNYSILGIYCGMDKETAFEKLVYPDWQSDRDDDSYKTFANDNGDIISVWTEDEKIIGVSYDVNEQYQENTSEITQNTKALSQEDAIKLLKSVVGERDKETNFEYTFIYEEKTVYLKQEYYAIHCRWLVVDENGLSNHTSYVCHFFVAIDGSKIMYGSWGYGNDPYTFDGDIWSKD